MTALLWLAAPPAQAEPQPDPSLAIKAESPARPAFASLDRAAPARQTPGSQAPEKPARQQDIAPLAPLELSGEYRVKPKKPVVGENEKAEPEDDPNSPEGRQKAEQEREKDEREAEAGKLTSGARTLLFPSRETAGPRRAVQVLGSGPQPASQPLARFTAAEKPAGSALAAPPSSPGTFGTLAAGRQALEPPAAISSRPDLMTVAKAAVTHGFGATAAAERPRVARADIEVVAFSTARPFAGMTSAAAEVKIGGLDSARREPIAPLVFVPPPVDPLATP
jgi:hypothetical protein